MELKDVMQSFCHGRWLSQGEIYTIVTSKAAKGKQGAVVAMIKGTKSSEVIRCFEQAPSQFTT